MHWFKGTFTGNHLKGYPVSGVNFPSNQSIAFAWMIPRNLFHMFNCQTNDLHYSDSCERSWLVVELPEVSARPTRLDGK